MITIFTRNWWKPDPNDSDRMIPDSAAHKHKVCEVATAKEARNLCKRLNDEPKTAQQIRYGLKYEYTAHWRRP